MAYDIRILRLHRAHPFLLLFAPSGDAWRECDCYPQVPFPSVIPPAVIESWPPSGTGGYLKTKIYFPLRLIIFCLKAKYIFFQVRKSAGTPSGKYNEIDIQSFTHVFSRKPDCGRAGRYHASTCSLPRAIHQRIRGWRRWPACL